MGSIGCPEMLVMNEFMLHNIQVERRCEVHINLSFCFHMTDDTFGGPIPSRTGADNEYAPGTRDGGRTKLEGCRATLP
jgi:hypothetical protein